MRHASALTRTATTSAVRWVAATSAHAASIGSAIADAMRAADADEKLGLLVRLRARASIENAAVINALRDTTGDSQQGLRRYLRVPVPDNAYRSGRVYCATSVPITAIFASLAARPSRFNRAGGTVETCARRR